MEKKQGNGDLYMAFFFIAFVLVVIFCFIKQYWHDGIFVLGIPK